MPVALIVKSTLGIFPGLVPTFSHESSIHLVEQEEKWSQIIVDLERCRGGFQILLLLKGSRIACIILDEVALTITHSIAPQRR